MSAIYGRVLLVYIELVYGKQLAKFPSLPPCYIPYVRKTSPSCKMTYPVAEVHLASKQSRRVYAAT